MNGNLHEFVTLEPSISEDVSAKGCADERVDGHVAEPVDELSVFVYGTLKPGGRYYSQYCAQYSPEAIPALVRGKLYDFPRLGYPAMTVGEDWVHGYVLTFFQSTSVLGTILKYLDALEGYQSALSSDNESEIDGSGVDNSDADDDYIRIQLQTFLPSKHPFKRVWGYIMAEEKVQALNGVYLTNGRWLDIGKRE